MFKNAVGIFRVVTLLEGISFILLVFIAMPLKYMMGMPEAVRVIGMAHGILFILFVLMLIYLCTKYEWPLGISFLLFIAALLPFAPFIADRMIKKLNGAEESDDNKVEDP